MVKHRYFLVNRPYGIGTVPRPKELKFIAVPGDFGIVEYKKKLTKKEIWQYELEPKNEVEKAKYQFWFHSNRDEEKAKDLIKQVLKFSVKELSEYSGWAERYGLILKKDKLKKAKARKSPKKPKSPGPKKKFIGKSIRKYDGKNYARFDDEFSSKVQARKRAMEFKKLGNFARVQFIKKTGKFFVFVRSKKKKYVEPIDKFF